MTLLDSVNSFGQALKQVARSSEALPKNDPLSSSLSLDASDIAQSLTKQLLDLTLPESLDWLTAPLQALKFTIEPVRVPGRFGSPSRSYHVIRNSAGKCALFHIPKSILQNGESWDAVGTVIAAVQLKDQTLLILSEGLDAAHVAYSVMVEPFWLNEFNIRASFIPWRHLQEIKALTPEEQPQYLPKLLKLEELLAKAQESLPAGTVITDEELLKIANMLALVARFTDEDRRGWRVTFQAAGLEELVGSFEFNGAPDIVAFDVLRKLNTRMPLNSRPNHPVLGMFLSAVLTIEEIPKPNQEYIRQLVVKYRLVPQEVA